MIEIKPNIPGALANQQLQRNLKHTLTGSLESRNAAVAAVPNWQDLRNHARQVKLHTLERLDLYLERLETKIEANGGKVVWAEDTAAAVAAIVEIARSRSARKVVKSKSMLTEEIHLNPALEDAGLDVVETDLGEYIVQLCGEVPSHLVTPALHKSKEEVAELFIEKLGMTPTDDIGELTQAARRVLRQHFLSADVGISGVNFAVAETGTLVVVENEGNARLSTSVPRTHIAIMGIEKVIPRVSDLAVFLKLLIRSATGQKVTSYINLISGPRRAGEVDGPEEFYLILVDNGRTKVHSDLHFRQSLACIRCGICLNVCPVFQKIGGHAYGSVYQGPIGSVLTPQFLSESVAPQHPFASSLCGACKEICPVKIEIPDLLLELRQRVQEKTTKGRPFGEKAAMIVWAWMMTSPFRYKLASWLVTRIARRFISKGKPLLNFPPLSAWQKKRDLPPIPARSLKELYRARGGRK
ncbi:MAG: iron-sulfur cluster-binding protein [Acidobacteriota bacterium]|nr:MAG: iron-sulfur cluster-binding protein [Acidobacteriota bacterium]